MTGTLSRYHCRCGARLWLIAWGHAGELWTAYICGVCDGRRP